MQASKAAARPVPDEHQTAPLQLHLQQRHATIALYCPVALRTQTSRPINLTTGEQPTCVKVQNHRSNTLTTTAARLSLQQRPHAQLADVVFNLARDRSLPTVHTLAQAYADGSMCSGIKQRNATDTAAQCLFCLAASTAKVEGDGCVQTSRHTAQRSA